MDHLEEFQESDVMFSLDYSSWDQKSNNDGKWNKNPSLPRNDTNKKQQRMSMRMMSSPSTPVSVSAPVSIPFGTGFCRFDIDMAEREPSDQDQEQDYDYDDDDDYDQMMMDKLPPHLIVERRVSGEIARSFSPLKGRNLCQVRNSILRMTGFLER